jgi:hypothetical protein
VLCFFSHNNNDHGGRRVNTVRALAQWQHLVASHEATVALHWAMLIALYKSSSMVIKIAIELVTCVNIICKNAARKKNLPHF